MRGLGRSADTVEIGFLLPSEFLALRNPQGKRHDDGSYDLSLDELNALYLPTSHVTTDYGDYRIDHLPNGAVVRRHGRPVMVVRDGVGYFDDPVEKTHVPKSWRDRTDARMDLGAERFVRVKYLGPLLSLDTLIREKNLSRYPYLVQNLGDGLELRAEQKPERDAGTTLAVFDGQGKVLAQASNEWGATLLVVAREARGRGLGKVIGRYWYEYNPSFGSGGFTRQGEENALGLWADRVRELSASGVYSAAVRRGQIDKAKVKLILAEARKMKPARPLRAAPSAEILKGKGLLLLVEEPTFLVYDRAFFDDPDPKWIKGYGFFRSAPKVGTFLYRIEYEPEARELTTRAALQMARDMGESLFDGEGYHDMVELDGIEGVVRHGDRLVVTRDTLPTMETLAFAERRFRRSRDPHREFYHQLLELAEQKWS